MEVRAEGVKGTSADSVGTIAKLDALLPSMLDMAFKVEHET